MSQKWAFPRVDDDYDDHDDDYDDKSSSQKLAAVLWQETGSFFDVDLDYVSNIVNVYYGLTKLHRDNIVVRTKRRNFCNFWRSCGTEHLYYWGSRRVLEQADV